MPEDYPDYLYRDALAKQSPTGAYRAPPEISEAEAQLRTAKAVIRHAAECVDKAIAAMAPPSAKQAYDDQTRRHLPKWHADWGKPRNDELPSPLAKSVTLPNCDGNSGSRIATPAELAELRSVLTAEELKGFGIGDVQSRHPMQAVALQDADEYNRADGETGV